MPPLLPRKRLRDPEPAEDAPPAKRAARPARRQRARESLFETLDATPSLQRTLSQTKALLELEGSDSDLSSASSGEFEEVELKGAPPGKGKQKAAAADDDDTEDDEEWEDALGGGHHAHAHDAAAPEPSGDISLNLSAAANASVFDTSAAGGKKGPSKIQRHIRMVTHCMHVQFLMFHNLMRNAWIQDQEVQRILVKGLNKGCWDEIERWWRDAAIRDGHLNVIEGGYSSKVDVVAESSRGKGKSMAGTLNAKSKDRKTPGRKSKEHTTSTHFDRNSRDWGSSSTQLEPNTPNLSSGDPLIRLLKYLSAFWKQKYKVTAPSLRKRGYLPPWALEAEIEGWKQDPSNTDNCGEKVENVEAFRDIARKLHGSRDVGHQLFTALLRGIGIEARLVASLQPVGFGWSQSEEGKPRKNLDKPDQNGTSSKTPQKLSLEDDTTPISDPPSDSDASIQLISSTKKASTTSRKPSHDPPSPTYWTEALSPTTRTPIAVSPLPLPTVAPASSPESLAPFYPRGVAADKAKQVFAYLIAFSADGTAKDVTTRYLPRHTWPGRTKGFRLPIEKIPVYNRRGKVLKYEKWDWFKSVLRPYARHPRFNSIWDTVEDEGDLVPAKPTATTAPGVDEEGGKETLQGYKNSATYVLERHLRREEALLPHASPERHFTTGKGANATAEPVYRRADVVACKTVESWHKEGRAVKEGEQPLKFVPMRAVTVTRKREIAERELEEGGKVKQGLYARAQTDWIIPEPIVDGRIPKNVFGNIDVYVPSMVPRGAVHLPLKGAARVCRKLGVEYAEACTGFEFGRQRAVPVLTGVVVAEGNEEVVREAWAVEEAEKRKKERAKREALVLGLWKKFFLGLRIVERLRGEYGDAPAHEVVVGRKSGAKDEEADEALPASQEEATSQEAQLEGGFLRDGDEDVQALGGGFIVEHDDDDALQNRQMNTAFPHTPISLQSAHLTPTNGIVTEDPESTDITSDEDDDAPILPPPKSQPAARGRGRGRGRASRAPAPTPLSRSAKKAAKRKMDTEEEDESSSSSDSASDFQESTNMKATPKRQPVRKMQSAVRSQYFEHAGDGAEESGSGRRGGRRRGRG